MLVVNVSNADGVTVGHAAKYRVRDVYNVASVSCITEFHIHRMYTMVTDYLRVRHITRLVGFVVTQHRVLQLHSNCELEAVVSMVICALYEVKMCCLSDRL